MNISKQICRKYMRTGIFKMTANIKNPFTGFVFGLFVFVFISFWMPLPIHAETQETTDIIRKNWDNNYYETVTVDIGSTKVEVDGEKESFSQVFDMNEKEARESVSSVSHLKESLEYCEVKNNHDGSATVTSPYQTKRIVIPEKNVSGYGESDGVWDDNVSILQFKNEEDTKNAFVKIQKKYRKAYVDTVLSSDSLLKGYQCVSWGSREMGLEQLKNSFPSSREITVAVIDTGLDKTSSVFDGHKISPYSRNMIYGTNNYADNNNASNAGHGTHVSGIICDATPSNVGIMALKVFDNNGKTTVLAISNAIEYAVEHDADVINMSLGIEDNEAESMTFWNDPLHEAYVNNIPVFVASGNDNMNIRYSYPANLSTTIAVGAVDKNLQRTSGSDYGNSLDFVAPGSRILSAKRGSRTEYASMSGTSMACPHISAVGAYLKMIYPSYNVSSLYNVMKKASIDLGSRGKDSYYGWGLLSMESFIDTEDISDDNRDYDLSDMTDLYADDILDDLYLINTVRTYNGKPQNPALSETLPSGYKVKFTQYTNAGTYYAKAFIYKNGELEKTIGGTFTINKCPLKKDFFSLRSTSYNYNGNAIRPDFSASLSSGNYSVSYSNNVNPGKGTIIFTGKGNYEGSVEFTFNIMNPKNSSFNGVQKTSDGQSNLSKVPCEMQNKTFVYDGKSHSIFLSQNLPAGVSVRYSGNNQTHAGTYQVTATITSGSEKMVKTGTMTIRPRNISNVKIAKKKYKYKGKRIKPKITANGTFCVLYYNNHKPGKAKAVVKGTGNYSGKVTVTFKILPNFKKCRVSKGKIVFSLSSGRNTRIWRKKGSGTWKIIKTTSKNYFTDKNVRKNSKYSYRLECNGMRSDTITLKAK